MLLAGIYSSRDGFPTRYFGNDVWGKGDGNGGNLWVIRWLYKLSP